MLPKFNRSFATPGMYQLISFAELSSFCEKSFMKTCYTDTGDCSVYEIYAHYVCGFLCHRHYQNSYYLVSIMNVYILQ